VEGCCGNKGEASGEREAFEASIASRSSQSRGERKNTREYSPSLSVTKLRDTRGR